MTGRAPHLKGRLVTLRPFSAGFAPAEIARMYEWARDPELLQLAGGVGLETSFDDFRRVFLAQLPRRNSATSQWFAVLADHQVFVGRAGLYGMSPDRHRAEAGIIVGDRRYWDRGFGRDALAALVDYGFDGLSLAHVVLQTYPRNVRARRAFQAVGFTTQREITRFSLDRGSHRTIQMMLTRGRWEQLRG